MHQFLRMVNCSRLGSDQVAAYILHPTASSPSTSNDSSSQSITATNVDNSSSGPSTGSAAPARESTIPPSTGNSANNNPPDVPTNVGDSLPSSAQDSTPPPASSGERTSSSAASGDYRGVFAIFRARDSGSWNLDATDIDNEPTDIQPSSMLLDQSERGDAIDFNGGPETSGLSMSVNSDSSTLVPGETDASESISFRSHADWSDNRPSSSSSPPTSVTATASESVDGVVGVGRVINVSGSPRTSYLSHGSNHSSSFSSIGNQQGNGTAVATATARTFRHVHTAVVVTDGTNGGPQLALSTAINRAIAGAFAGSGEGAVASNIINTTHRLQWWDFSKVQLPDLKNGMSRWRL